MTDSSDSQTKPACPACGARLDASFDPGDPCPNCEEGTLVALPEVVESDLGQQSDVAGASGLRQGSDTMSGLDEFSSPPDFSGGLGDQDTTTRTDSIPEQTTPKDGGGSSDKAGSRRLGQSVSESKSADDPFTEFDEPSTAENPSLPKMQAQQAESEDQTPSHQADPGKEPEQKHSGKPPKPPSGQQADESGEDDSKGTGFVPPPSSVVQEMPEEDDEPEEQAKATSGSPGRDSEDLGRESSAPAPTLPDDASDEPDRKERNESDRGRDDSNSRRPDSAEASGELESTLETDGPSKQAVRSEQPSAEELIEEEEEPAVERPTDAELSSEPEVEQKEESGSTWMLVGIGVLLAAAVAGVLVASGLVDLTGGSGADSAETSPNPTELMRARADAVTAATKAVSKALNVETSDPKLRKSVASRLKKQGASGSASHIYDAMWRNGSRSREFTLDYVDTLIQGNRYHRARIIALAGARLHDNTSDFQDRYLQAVEADSALGDAAPINIGEDFDVVAVSEAREKDVVALYIRTKRGDGEPDYVFFPETTDVRAWRNHVASWKLCEVLGCSFEVPWTRTARMTRQTYEQNRDATVDGAGKRAGRARRAPPGEREVSYRWRTPEQSDTEYLYGALRKWPGELIRWPIEAFEVWRPWMNATRENGTLETPAADAWAAFSSSVGEQQVSQIQRAAAGQKLRPYAAQLSDVLLFDYLTNNWGRFAPDTKEYGANNHFREGRFVTVDTSQTFQRRHSRRVKGRFSWTDVFRQETIFALRWIDREQLLNIVYPEPTAPEEAKFTLVWEQRDRVLKRVDSLVEKYGGKRIFPFPVVPLWPVE